MTVTIWLLPWSLKKKRIITIKSCTVKWPQISETYIPLSAWKENTAGIKASFHGRQSRSQGPNQKGRTLQSSEDIIRILLSLLKTLSFMIKWKLGCRKRKQKQENETNHKVWEHAFWLVYPSASASNSDNLVSLDHKQNVSDGVAAELEETENVLTLLTLIHSHLWLPLCWVRISYFHSVISAIMTPLTTPTSTLSLEKTSLKAN